VLGPVLGAKKQRQGKKIVPSVESGPPKLRKKRTRREGGSIPFEHQKRQMKKNQRNRIGKGWPKGENVLRGSPPPTSSPNRGGGRNEGGRHKQCFRTGLSWRAKKKGTPWYRENWGKRRQRQKPSNSEPEKKKRRKQQKHGECCQGSTKNFAPAVKGEKRAHTSRRKGARSKAQGWGRPKEKQNPS